jgi:hypothetical protein
VPAINAVRRGRAACVNILTPKIVRITVLFLRSMEHVLVVIFGWVQNVIFAHQDSRAMIASIQMLVIAPGMER